MVMDAIVLAGGRSSRLFGHPKATLVYRGTTLLDRAIQSAIDANARTIAIVGNQPFSSSDPRLVTTREEPAYGGPVAGIGAGMTALADANSEPAQLLLVMACDLPEVDRAIAPLLSDSGLPNAVDGLVLVDDTGTEQPLTALYRTSAMAAALRARREHAPLDGLSMRALLADLHMQTVRAPAGTNDDIDTWDQAARHGIDMPNGIRCTHTEEP